MRELIALAKSKPGVLNYSSVGLGSVAHLATELLSNMTGIKLNHIPYRSASQAVIDLAEGRIDITFGTLGSSLPLIKDGKIKIAGGEHRAARQPGARTSRRWSKPACRASRRRCGSRWSAPPGLPAAITARLNKEVNAIIADPAVIKGLRPAGDAARSDPARSRWAI